MKHTIRPVLIYVFLVVLALIIAIPLFHILVSAFKTNQEIARMDLFPGTPGFQNFMTVFENPYTVYAFVNTAIIAGAALTVTISITSLAAYGISRRKERVFSFLYSLFLLAMVIPAVSSMVPLYRLITALGLMNTRAALILIYATGSIPFGILLYTSFIKTIPQSLDEAGMIEGCSYLQRFYRIVFPLLKPVSASLVILRLPAIWNDFMMPLLFIRDNWKKPITLVVYSFTWEHNQDFGAIFALLVMATIPPVVFFLLGQQHIYKSIAAGAVKG